MFIIVLYIFQQLGALQDVLEKLQTKRLSMWEKKFGQVPTVNKQNLSELRLKKQKKLLSNQL